MAMSDISVDVPPRGLIWMLGSITALASLSVDLYLPGLPELTRSLHATASAGQLTLTSSVLGIAVGQFVAGPISDSRGRRPLVVWGLVGFITMSALCGVSPTVWVLIVARFVQGICAGTAIVVARAIVRDVYDGSRAAKKFASLIAIQGISPIVAPLIGAQVLAISSWRGVFVALMVIATLMLASAGRLLPETLALDRRQERNPSNAARILVELVTDRRFAPFLVSLAFATGAMFCYLSGASFALENVYGVSPQAFGVLFAVNAVGLGVMVQVSRRLVEKTGPELLFQSGVKGMVVGAAGTLIVSVAHAGIVLQAGSFFVLLSSMGLVVPNGTAAAMAARPDTLGSASGLLGLFQYTVGAGVAPLVGLGGADNAVPMGIVMASCAAISLGVNAMPGARAKQPHRIGID
jgi:MFS transporter, DHA1 family, multidrug resistance protein